MNYSKMKKAELLEELKKLERQVDERHDAGRSQVEKKEEDALDYAESIVATVREPLLILDGDLRVISANRPFCENFEVTLDETRGKLVYDLGNRQWDIPRLRELLEKILPENNPFECFEVDHDFETIGHKTMLLNARRIRHESNKKEMILLAIEDITERRRAEDELGRYRSHLEEVVEERVKELNCLYNLSGLAEQPGLSFEQFLQSVPSLLAAACRYPEITCVRVAFGNKEYQTDNFAATSWKQTADIRIRGNEVGIIEVYCLQATPDSDEGPFPKEERALIEAVAEQIGKIAEHMKSMDRIQHLNTMLLAIRNVNKLIVTEQDREKLLKNTCETLIGTKGFLFAWAAMLDDSGRFIKVLESGAGDYEFLPVFKRLRSGKLVPCVKMALNQPGVVSIDHRASTCMGCPLSLKCPGAGVLCARLEYEGKIYGILSVLSPIFYMASVEERMMFEEVIGDISFAMYTMELREKRNYAEKARLQSEANYKDLYSNAPIAYFSVGLDGHIGKANKAAENLLGYGLEELKSMKVYNLYADESKAKAKQLFDKFKNGISCASEEMVYKRKNGREIHGLLSVDPVKDKNGQLVESRSIVVDITERIHAQKARWESEEKFRSLVANVPNIIMIVDREGIIKFINQTISGLSVEDVTGKNHFECIDKEFHDIVKETIERVYETGEPGHYSIKGVGPGESTSWYATQVGPVRRKGKIEEVLLVTTNITEHMEIEEAIRENEAKRLVIEELKNLDRLKDEFVSTVTHELRTPMTPLRSTVEMLLDGSLGEITPEQRKFIEMMARNINRLSQFTTEVLTLSRLESGRYKMHPKIRKLSEVIGPVVELLEKNVSDKKQTLTLDINEDISAYVDGDSLAQVVSNCVSNAIVHTPEGTAINISSRKLDGMVEVSVVDDGPGIPQDAIKSIFNRFFQAAREEGPGYQGSGIGLAVCKALIEAMGGDIRVESEEGKGAAFIFTVPASPENNIREEPENES